uniref:G-protein coupled receptors family 1 profile domain-containing protein n=1 Tax=Piliocolobus tephrosceles TaxID=591936 RepID=A0A8C9HC51_9PRIM
MGAGPNKSYFSCNHWLAFSVYLLTFLVGLPLNLLALVVFVGKLQCRPVAVDVLLLNLTASDLLLLLGMHWPLPFILCPLSGFIFFTAVYLTALFLTAMSIGRFLSVAHPLWYKTRPRLGQGRLVNVACWLLSSAHCSVVCVMEFSRNSSHRQNTIETCFMEFQEDQLVILLPVWLEMVVALFVVPLIITNCCYSRLVWILGRRGSHRWQRRVAGLVAATLLNFLVCFGPLHMSHVMGFVQGESTMWRTYVMLLSTLNSYVDPLVYSSGFQANLHGLLRRLCGLWGQWQQEGSPS